MREQGSWERPVAWGWRRKGGLETPLRGRIVGENKRLIFAPPVWYDALVFGYILGGPLAYFLVQSGVPIPIISNPGVDLFACVGVTLAGIWGALSNERMTCDLRARTYARLEGQSFKKRLTRGGLQELDAVVLLAEEMLVPSLGGRTVIYRLVLHWKGSKEPLLVIERESRTLPPGAPINSGAGAMLQRGTRYANLLGVRFFDNAYFHSGAPVPVV